MRLITVDVIDYWFSDGTSPVTHWQAPADHGLVYLDFDGDGRLDDAMLDLDADGRADQAALDLNDDGTLDAHFRDDGTGLWAIPVTSPDNPARETEPASNSGTPARSCRAPSVAQPPPTDVQPLSTEPGAPPRQVLVDTDSDGQPNVLLFDSDNDGISDGAVHLAPTASGFPAQRSGAN